MYEYETQKPELFTERGVELLRKVERKLRGLLDASHACMLDAAMSGVSGDDWTVLAAIDYLAEQDIVAYVETASPRPTQYRILIRGPRYAHG